MPLFTLIGLLLALPGKSVRPERLAIAMGVYFTCHYGGIGLLSALAGYTRDLTGSPAAPMWFAGSMLIFATLVLVQYRLRLLPTDSASRPVSRVLSGGLPLRDGHSSGARIAPCLEQPTRAAARIALDAEVAPSTRAAPIRSCSRWGLPCRLRCRTRGALLPHRFTLAFAVRPRRRSVLCGTFPGVAPGGR